MRGGRGCHGTRLALCSILLLREEQGTRGGRSAVGEGGCQAMDSSLKVFGSLVSGWFGWEFVVVVFYSRLREEGGGWEALAPRCSILLLLLLREEQGSRGGRCRGTGAIIWIFSMLLGGFCYGSLVLGARFIFLWYFRCCNHQGFAKKGETSAMSLDVELVFFLFNFTSSSLLVLVNCLFALGEDLLWLALLNRSCSIFQELWFLFSAYLACFVVLEMSFCVFIFLFHSVCEWQSPVLLIVLCKFHNNDIFISIFQWI